MKREEIGVTFENGILTLKGERKVEKDVKRENFQRIERRYGSFTRSFTLPNTVDASRISASYKRWRADDPAPAARRGEAEADRRQRRVNQSANHRRKAGHRAGLLFVRARRSGLRAPPGAGRDHRWGGTEGLIQVVCRIAMAQTVETQDPAVGCGPHAARRTDHQPLPLRRRCSAASQAAQARRVAQTRASDLTAQTRASGDGGGAPGSHPLHAADHRRRRARAQRPRVALSPPPRMGSELPRSTTRNSGIEVCR